MVYLLFFLSGAAALIYEVVWVRSFSLVFGGSQLAVTTVLSIYMTGLALGGYLVGRLVEKIKDPLRLYALLELGIGLSALLSFGLIKLYPDLYIFLARGRDDSYFYLSSVRVVFASMALIVPTFFMGGTLPVLSKFLSDISKKFLSHISFLYGFNTLGAVVGTIMAGFVLLPKLAVNNTLFSAVLLNFAIGIAALALNRKSLLSEKLTGSGQSVPVPAADYELNGGEQSRGDFQYKLVLLGIGLSGFCALGYEVLWTRILAVVIGATVYGFTTMLAAFLTGMALGSKCTGVMKRVFPGRLAKPGNLVLSFGLVQVIIAILALVVTIKLRGLAANSLLIYSFFEKMGIKLFTARQFGNLMLSFLYMIFPAFFMGAAFPIAGALQALYRKKIGTAIGEVLAFNTIGAILGAAASGFLLIYLFGIEHSLQFLILINASIGILVILSLKRSKRLLWSALGLLIVPFILLGAKPDLFNAWDHKYFAMFQSNRPDAFATPALVEEALETTDVLYYKEGAEATVSSIRRKWGEQSFITNGRVEASTIKPDMQLQYALGYLPTLLSRNPHNVLVIGLGSGMTAGATSIFPSVSKVTLVELEPAMLGVAGTFGPYNHNVLQNPKLKIIFNDGRNYLLTTKEKFDVITADPIHPWFRGAGYLYTAEYFKLASSHLADGGVICQWLPIYELSLNDLKSVVKTFQGSFKYVLLWLTHWDSIIVGSNSPIKLDEEEIEKRISSAEIKADMESMNMGSATDLLGYFVMGWNNMEQFSKDGALNTDDNLYLEFSAPLSMGKYLANSNAEGISKYRESIIPYLSERTLNRKNIGKWLALDAAGKLYDRAHFFFLRGKYDDPDFLASMESLEKNYPWYGPEHFLKNIYLAEKEKSPQLVSEIRLPCLRRGGEMDTVHMVILKTKVSPDAAFLDFCDPDRQVRFGKSLLIMDKNGDFNVEDELEAFANSLMDDVKSACRIASAVSFSNGGYALLRQKTVDNTINAVLKRRETSYMNGTN